MAKTKIEWAEKVWNPVTGCTKVSEGCRNCYAERMAKRLAGRCGYPEAPNQFSVTMHPEKLEEPLHWKKPARIFVDSMGDLFHPQVPDTFIDQVFWIMMMAPIHTFIILTKRPKRMVEWVNKDYQNPLPNVWLGASVEDQKTADERIPWLLQTPAAVRFVSVEPMLGPVDLKMTVHFIGGSIGVKDWHPDWTICGGETGPGARPIQLEWAESLLNQCLAANIPFFFKSWGEYYPAQRVINGKQITEMMRIGRKLSGRILNGKEWDECPQINNNNAEK